MEASPSLAGQIESRAGASPVRTPVKPAWLRLRIVVCIIGIDLMSIGLGIGMAALLRHIFLGSPNPGILLGTVVPVHVIVAANSHAYSLKRVINAPFLGAKLGLKSLAVAAALTIFTAFSFKASEDISRWVTIIGLIFSGIVMALGRYFFLRHFATFMDSPFITLVIREDGTPCVSTDGQVLTPDEIGIDPDRHDPLMYDRLAKRLQFADRVIVACRPERRTAWAHALKGTNLQSEILVPELAALSPIAIDRLGRDATMVVATGPLELSDRVVKRAFDIVIASILLWLLLPLLIGVAIAIKLDSRGPVLFRQPRIGRGNKIFEILKFRSMRVEDGDSGGHRSTARDDERITRVGRWIRSSSIDELPQLYNVLRGHMSIVGSRPHALSSRAANKLFWEIDSRYWHRHAAKPGLTGLAQIRGYRGATMIEEYLTNRLQADLEYLDNWSLWRDIVVVFLTLRVLLHRNAF
ncbi:sugar transferase [Sphingosinithalassobacter sp. CS137]|uniref:sugar transferase n=1 Tax=Sphingosinithalassobacter sp. CS137 TaxID=2762748 RepID=UPI0021CFE3C2|nr:sugar transferase [Sphingosinithalassobacter sp. CS137]